MRATFGEVGELHELEGPRDPGPAVALVEVLAPAQAVSDVALDVEVRKQRVALEDGVERSLVSGCLGDVDAVDEDLPGGGLFEAGQHAQGRRLAAPGRTEQRVELAGCDVDVDAVHGDDLVEGLAQADDRDRSSRTSCGLGVGHAEECRSFTSPYCCPYTVERAGMSRRAGRNVPSSRRLCPFERRYCPVERASRRPFPRSPTPKAVAPSVRPLLTWARRRDARCTGGWPTGTPRQRCRRSTRARRGHGRWCRRRLAARARCR
jgi:hypothetical protein